MVIKNIILKEDKKMKHIFTLFFSIALVVNGLSAQNVGQIAPDFTLKDLSNADYTLSEKRGNVILVFLVGHSCSFCLASAPSVQSEIIESFSGNQKFQAVVIDVWDGGTSSVQGFKNRTGMTAKFLQKGSSVGSSWSTTYDRLVVIDAEGKIAYKGNSAARTNVGAAKSAVQTALDNALTTSATIFDASEGLKLGQNYPNPMQDETKISFQLDAPAGVRFTIYDITGKVAAIPINNFYQSGEHELVVQRNDFKSGIYFYQINAGGVVLTKRMVVK